MNLAQIKNDGVIGMESEESFNRNSFESDFGNDMGPLKRDHDDELDRSQVKKRRKQSKPIRIASTESLSDETEGNGKEEKSSDDLLGSDQTPNDEKSCKNDSDGDCSTNEDNGNESFLSEADVKKESPYPLNLSHTKSPSPKDSVESFPVSSCEDRNWYKPPESVPTSLYTFPSLDHASLKSQVYPYNLLLPSQNPGLVPPNFKRIFVGNNENQIGSPHRIFNPEAFCDLCNKEFCNKYFLKTHKANKHGIYTDTATPNSMEPMSTLPIITYFSNNLPNLPIPLTQISKKPSGSFGNGSSKTNSSSMRAFCNICQREFCNKYFVRRHKAKIHGIIENAEETSQEYKPPLVNDKQDEPALPGPSGGKMNFDSLLNNSVMKDEHESIYEDDKCKIIKDQETESELVESPQNALHFLVSSWPNEETKECSKSPERNKKSGSNSAFCDICCKEYCNKYFLRIHKQKCHGIPITDKEEKPKDFGGGNSNHSWKSGQPMPLNLILRETNQNVHENEAAITCSQCDMVFPEQYLLKIHYNLVHNLKLDTQLQNMNPLSLLSGDQNKNCSETSFKNSAEFLLKPYQNDINDAKYLSSDVQRLHGMIMKLNQQNQLDNFICDVCNTDFGRSSSLENHIIKEHSALLEEISNGFYEDNHTSQVGSNKWECPKCPSSFATSNLLDLHLSEKHNMYDAKIAGRNGEEDMGSHLTPTGERSVLHTPTSSFCEICKKELCNKYFMKTHMQRMHGISIENGAHIGGVVCDICNKELCSKYFLRVHKQNSHGIVEEAFLPQIGGDVKGQNLTPDSALKPSDNELSHRYFSHFTEVCSICSRRFRSVKWLKTHLLNDHGEEGKEKWKELQQQNGSKPDKFLVEASKKNDPYCCPPFRNPNGPDLKTNEPSTSYQPCDSISSMLNKTPAPKSYQCSYCSFSTTVMALLFVHERSHFPNAPENTEFRVSINSPPKDQETSEPQLSTNKAMNCFPKEEQTNYNSNFDYQSSQSEKDGMINDDNNYTEAKDQRASRVGEAGVRCLKCPYTTQQLEVLLEHMQKEHKCDDSGVYLQIVRDALIHIASTSVVPASFALPSNLGSKFTMQPFVVEDKSNSTFITSVVFLPVKEKLSTPVTASFRLTPT